MFEKAKPLWIGLVLAGCGVALLAQSAPPAPAPFETPAQQQTKADDEGGADAFDNETPKQVQVQVEFVEIPHETLTQLLFMAKPGSADATKLRQTLQDRVAKNEAKVLETQMICARSGQKATAEAIHEFIYPTEYMPPEIPISISGEQGLPPRKLPTLPYLPTAFETRNLGSTIEIEPTISEDDDLIDLRFIPEIVWQTGNTSWVEHTDEMGNRTQVQMTDIYTLRLNTQLFCKSGQYTLVATLSPKNDKGDIDLTRKVMVFLKCDIVSVR